MLTNQLSLLRSCVNRTAQTTHMSQPFIDETKQQEFGNYLLCYNSEDHQPIKVTASNHLYGYVVAHKDSGEKGHVFILDSGRAVDRMQFQTSIERVSERGGSGAFPEIVEFGEYETSPFYITKPRSGKTIDAYCSANSLEPRQAARVLSLFLSYFLDHQAHGELIFDWQSLWVEETIFGPELSIRDLSLAPEFKESELTALIKDVFHKFCGDSFEDSIYASWQKRLNEECRCLVELRDCFEALSKASLEGPVMVSKSIAGEREEPESDQPAKDKVIPIEGRPHHSTPEPPVSGTDVLRKIFGGSQRSIFSKKSYLDLGDDSESERKSG